VDQTLSRLGRERNIRLVAAHFNVALSLLAQTDLLLTVPRDVLAQGPSLKWGLREVPFPVELFRHQIAMSRGAADDPGVAWVVRCILQAASGAPA